MDEASNVDQAVQDDVSLKGPGRVGRPPHGVPLQAEAENEWDFGTQKVELKIIIPFQETMSKTQRQYL